jgi:hypothetical protein
LKYGTESDSKGKTEERKRHEAPAVKENILNESTGRLVRFDGLSRKSANSLLDKVGNMQNTRAFDGHGNPDGDESKPVVNCIISLGGIDVVLDKP